MQYLELSQGKVAIVCDCHYNLVCDRKWSFADGYASWSRLGEKMQKIHRVIAGAAPGEIVDHINRDKLDNRCSNLRVVTHQLNVVNRGKQRNNTSGYPGVQWRKARQKWIAIIGRNGRYRKLGSFDTPEAAYAVYLEAQNG